MKHLLAYNESVRDKMTPKSDDDIKQYISNLSQEEKDKKLLEFSLKHYKNWVKVLLDEGANPNYKMDGNTLIFRVIVGGITSRPDLDIVRMLLEAGADPTVPNVRGIDTLSIDTLKYAKYWKKWDIVELIEPYYNKGVNESIRDMMTPKPEESIKVSLRDYFNERRKVKNPTKSIMDLEFLDMNNLYFVNDENKYYEQIDDYIGSLTWSKKGQVLNFPDKEYIIYPEIGIVKYWNKGAMEGIYFDGRHIDGIIKYISDNRLSESIRDKMIPKSDNDIDNALDNMDKEQMSKALLYAAQYKDFDIAKKLLKKGVDINTTDDFGWTALMVASEFHHVEMAEFLIKNGADVNMKDENDITALSLAYDYNDHDMIKLLRNNGATQC